jgi:uncharacterized membrane protein
VLIMAAYLRIRSLQILPERRYRSPGGRAGAWLMLALTVIILVSCLQLDALTAGSIVGFYVVATIAFLVLHAARRR